MSATAVNPWITKSSKVVYENPWISVREDQVIRPDGKPGIYGVIDLRPSICVVAINGRDEVVLVGQWRYTVQRYSWEVPRGGSFPDETDILAAAKRELAEETGTIAAKWQTLGAVDICNGVANDVQTIFLATELSDTAQNLDPEEDITINWVPFLDALQMAMDGRITEVCTIAALLKVAVMRTAQ